MIQAVGSTAVKHESLSRLRLLSARWLPTIPMHPAASLFSEVVHGENRSIHQIAKEPSLYGFFSAAICNKEISKTLGYLLKIKAAEVIQESR